ncbi:hypothetical protein D3C80_2043650 [compost metagenome]
MRQRQGFEADATVGECDGLDKRHGLLRWSLNESENCLQRDGLSAVSLVHKDELFKQADVLFVF